jgi:hypothetical protein
MNGHKIYVLRRSKTELHTYEGRSLRTAGATYWRNKFKSLNLGL